MGRCLSLEVSLRFVLVETRLVQSLTEFPSMFGMVTLACICAESWMWSRKTFERIKTRNLEFILYR